MTSRPLIPDWMAPVLMGEIREREATSLAYTIAATNGRYFPSRRAQDLHKRQPMQALGRANEIRLGRAALKAEVKYGSRTAADVLERPPSCAGNMPIGELLQSQSRWGRVRTRKLLSRADPPISDGKSIGALTVRQRTELMRLLGGTR